MLRAPVLALRETAVNHTDFSQLGLPAALQDNLDSLGYQQMTPIQAQSLPLVLAGKDLIAKAKTGSGKTAAFGLGLLAHWTSVVWKCKHWCSAPPASWPTRWPPRSAVWHAACQTSNW